MIEEAEEEGRRLMGGNKVKIYIDTRDWWVGYYRGPHHHYICPVPLVVIRWKRRG